MTDFEEIAKASAKWRKEIIKIIPDNCNINPQYLGTMTNNEFVFAFNELQRLIISIYEDVQKAPFDWGYPSKNNTASVNGTAYNRVSDFFLGIAQNGVVSGKELIVSSQTGLKSYDPNAGFRFAIRTHKKIEAIFEKLTNFGFDFEGYGENSDSFAVSYTKNPLVLEVLCAFAKAQDNTITYDGAYNVTFASFSYRWVEDPKAQKYEPIFLAKMDMSPKQIQDIQYWLYDKAMEYGYKIDKKKPFDKECVHYTKGSKEFILVGEKSFDGTYRMAAKVIFRNVFLSEPDKVIALAKKFPAVFGKSYASCTRCEGRKCKDESCSMRICYQFDGVYYENCAYQSFWFFNPTLDTFKDVFELFIIENKIK